MMFALKLDNLSVLSGFTAFDVSIKGEGTTPDDFSGADSVISLK